MSKFLWTMNGICIAGALASFVWAFAALLQGDSTFLNRYAIAWVFLMPCLGFILYRKLIAKRPSHD